MKYTKKMVIIPADEYNALLTAMMKTKGGGDLFQNEASKLDAQIAQTLTNPKFTPDIKQKKYNTLYKRRRVMKEIIENKPQKVIVQTAADVPPNVAPYLGLSSASVMPKNELKEKQLQQKNGSNRIKIARKFIQPKFDDTDEDAFYDVDTEDKKSTTRTSKSRKSTLTSRTESYTATPPQSQSSPPLTPERYLSSKKKRELLNHVEKNLSSFNVNTDGTIEAYRGTVKNSNFRDSVDYLAGARDTPPRGHKFFWDALKKDTKARELLGITQKGKGKTKKRRQVLVRFAPKLPLIKTRGLVREKPTKQKQQHPFKPRLWARL